MDLYLPLKKEYFDQICSGQKTEEYRLVTPYWHRRLQGKTFDRIILTCGYPKKNDHARRLVIAWKSVSIKKIRHDHFGDGVVDVFAIDVTGARL